MENGKITANGSDWCPNCKVKIMDNTCFCDWPDNEQAEYDRHCEERLSQQFADIEAQAFRDKIKSIAFNKVKGGGRGE